MNFFLYVATVVIWGSTWIAIHWQLGSVDAIVSIFYRFGIAAALFLPLLKLFGKLQVTQRRDHLFFVMQGACLFSVNYLFMYQAGHYIITGLMSVIFALVALFNAFNQWLIWRKKPSGTIYLASVLGLVGLVFLFWRELQISHNVEEVLIGIAFAMAGTYVFSLGNMVSVRNSQQGIKPWTSNAYGMIYGALIVFIGMQLFQVPFQWDDSPHYISSLIFLAVPGSIIAFTMYLVLVSRIGASQAAYTGVLFPVVALTFSTFIEDYHWDIYAIIGLALVMLGVVVSSRGEKIFLWLKSFSRLTR
ncbi:Permease of the drug/metabolite transporter (DMT) superfamily [gamma proteobacterium IMCC1989]|nr:Permease of the drug/metabolite transporter (DMT) superfamily [gamma proteobacterium IMCC1989]